MIRIAGIMLTRPNSEQDSPLISIITVSAFEHERLIKTLDSYLILNFLFEIVLVIPATDLASAGTIQSYKNRLKTKVIVVNDNNEGIYAAMNLGILNSSGIFSIFLNAGDEVSSKLNFKELPLELANIKEGWIILRPDLSWSLHHITHLSQVMDFFVQKNASFISHQSVLFRTELLRDFGGYDSKYKVIADTALMYQFFKRGDPYMSSLIFSEIETPNFASLNQRRSRIEFMVLILFTYGWDIKLMAFSNFIKREVQFLHSRMRRESEY